MSEHFSFRDVLNTIISNGENWGKTYPDRETAEKELMNDPQKLAAWTLFDMLFKFRKFTFDMAGIVSYRQAMLDEHTDNVYSSREHWKKFPGIKVGDILWWGDLDCGFSENIVLSVDDDDHCLIISLTNPDSIEENLPYIHWASGGYYRTLAEVVKIEANELIKFETPRVAWAYEALNELEKAEPDLKRFEEGKPDDVSTS